MVMILKIPPRLPTALRRYKCRYSSRPLCISDGTRTSFAFRYTYYRETVHFECSLVHCRPPPRLDRALWPSARRRMLSGTPVSRDRRLFRAILRFDVNGEWTTSFYYWSHAKVRLFYRLVSKGMDRRVNCKF